MQLLQSSNNDVKKQAVWALSNIAGNSVECRDAVLHAGTLPPLLELCTVDAEITLLREAAHLLSNLCRSAERTWWSRVCLWIRCSLCVSLFAAVCAPCAQPQAPA